MVCQPYKHHSEYTYLFQTTQGHSWNNTHVLYCSYPKRNGVLTINHGLVCMSILRHVTEGDPEPLWF